MKKIIYVLLSVTLVISLLACGISKETVSGKSSTQKTEQKQTKKQKSNKTKKKKTNKKTSNKKTANTKTSNTKTSNTKTANTQKETLQKMNITINGYQFTATLENNEAAHALSAMLKKAPLVISMSDYSGFEKVGSLGTTLPANDRRTTTHAGDIVLYNSNQIVMFYGSNSWSYTRLGKIDDLTNWETALGSDDITVTFSLK